MDKSIPIYEIIGRYVIAKQKASNHLHKGHKRDDTGCKTSPSNCPVMCKLMGRLTELEAIIRTHNDGALPNLDNVNFEEDKQ